MGVHAQTPLLNALSYVDSQLSRAKLDGCARARLEAQIEVASARPLTAILRETLQVLFRNIDAAHDCSCTLESCCAMVGHLVVNFEPAYDLSLELDGPEVLARALRSQPQHAGVANEALWALGYLRGARAIYETLSDPGLTAHGAVVRAAVHALAHLPDCKRPDVEGALCWEQRYAVAQQVVKAMQARTGDTEMLCLGCGALGVLMASWYPDVVHALAVRPFLLVVFEAMQTDPGSAALQAQAADAVLKIGAGNSEAASMICEERNARLLELVLTTHSGVKSVRLALAKVIGSVRGLRGILQALDSFSEDEMMVKDLLWTFSEGSFGNADLTASDVLDTGAVARISLLLRRWQDSESGVRHACVAALATCCKVLHPSSAETAAADQVLCLLVEAAQPVPAGPLPMRTEALQALAHAALDSPRARQLLQQAGLQELCAHWRIDRSSATATLLLHAALGRSVDPITAAMAEAPAWQCQLLSCLQALCSLGELEEREPGSLFVAAAPQITETVVACLRQLEAPWTLVHEAAADVLRMALAALGSSHAQLLEQGCKELIRAVVALSFAPRLLATALRALREVSEELPPARVLLQAPATVALLAGVVREHSKSVGAAVLGEALVALGLLGGLRPVVEAMDQFAGEYWLQVSGCVALAELARSRQALDPTPREELELAVGTVARAVERHGTRTANAALYSTAEMAVKLLGVSAAPRLSQGDFAV